MVDPIQTTIAHYRRHAHAFWQGTKDHDVSQNYNALLEALPKDQPLTILDLGCGPGRDLKYFKSLGHVAVGLDGCPEFCQMARSYTGCEVWQQEFQNLSLPQNHFDGIFANASLFHVAKLDFVAVLKHLHAALKPNGALFTSNPRGSGEHFDGERFAFYMEFDEYQKYLTEAGFSVVHHYYRPKDRPQNEQPWLAVVSRPFS